MAATQYTDTRPDGRPLTRNDVKVGDLVSEQTHSGLRCGIVVELVGSAVRYLADDGTDHTIARRRIWALARPTGEGDL